MERVISCTGVHSYVTVHVKLSVYTSLNLIGQWITASLTLRSALVGRKWPALRPGPLSSQGKRPISIEGETVWDRHPIWTL
jgi:hypothetical protein